MGYITTNLLRDLTKEYLYMFLLGTISSFFVLVYTALPIHMKNFMNTVDSHISNWEEYCKISKESLNKIYLVFFMYRDAVTSQAKISMPIFILVPLFTLVAPHYIPKNLFREYSTEHAVSSILILATGIYGIRYALTYDINLMTFDKLSMILWIGTLCIILLMYNWFSRTKIGLLPFTIYNFTCVVLVHFFYSLFSDLYPVFNIIGEAIPILEYLGEFYKPEGCKQLADLCISQNFDIDRVFVLTASRISKCVFGGPIYGYIIALNEQSLKFMDKKQVLAYLAIQLGHIKHNIPLKTYCYISGLSLLTLVLLAAYSYSRTKKESLYLRTGKTYLIWVLANLVLIPLIYNFLISDSYYAADKFASDVTTLEDTMNAIFQESSMMGFAYFHLPWYIKPYAFRPSSVDRLNALIKG